jgi:hypothetical protein
VAGRPASAFGHRAAGALLLAARAAVVLSPAEAALMPVLPAGRALNVCIVARKRCRRRSAVFRLMAN